MAAAKKTETTVMEIRPVEIEVVRFSIVGDSPLIMHKWSEKAKKMIRDTQTKAAKTKGHDIKVPMQDFIDSMYWLTEPPKEPTQEAMDEALSNGARFGFPVTGIKQAIISGAYRAGVVKDKVSIRGAFFLNGIDVEGTDMAEVIWDDDGPWMREDMVKVGMGSADIRYRGQFDHWHIPLELRYNKNGQYSLEQIMNLINLGGFSVGIGEWRPEHDGQFGMFHME